MGWFIMIVGIIGLSLSEPTNAELHGEKWIQVMYQIDIKQGDPESKLVQHPNGLVFGSQSNCLAELSGQTYINPPSITHAIPSCRKKQWFDRYNSGLNASSPNFLDKKNVKK